MIYNVDANLDASHNGNGPSSEMLTSQSQNDPKQLMSNRINIYACFINT